LTPSSPCLIARYRATITAHPATAISLYAARGDYEAAQVLFRPPSDAGGGSRSPTALAGPGGATIPVSEITVRRPPAGCSIPGRCSGATMPPVCWDPGHGTEAWIAHHGKDTSAFRATRVRKLGWNPDGTVQLGHLGVDHSPDLGVW
jgi:hypothetical protein